MFAARTSRFILETNRETVILFTTHTQMQRRARSGAKAKAMLKSNSSCIEDETEARDPQSALRLRATIGDDETGRGIRKSVRMMLITKRVIVLRRDDCMGISV